MSTQFEFETKTNWIARVAAPSLSRIGIIVRFDGLLDHGFINAFKALRPCRWCRLLVEVNQIYLANGTTLT